MSAAHTLIVCVTPRAVALNTPTLPVSVFVSPRLTGASELGAFPDWLDWTADIKQPGALAFEFRTHNGRTLTLPIDSGPLDQRLWREMFKPQTPVVSHLMPDYTDRTAISFSAREALSAIKGVYQEAAIAMAAPLGDGDPGDDFDQLRGRDPASGHIVDPGRALVKRLLDGLAVNWSDRTGEAIRANLRLGLNEARRRPDPTARNPGGLDSEGLYRDMVAPPGAAQTDVDKAKSNKLAVASAVAAYYHMPQGAPLDQNPQDLSKIIDFHRALSALNSYPALLRALGLVFHFELPLDFFPEAPPSAGTTLAARVVRQWRMAPKTPPAPTACLHFRAGADARLFMATPRVLANLAPRAEVFGLLNVDPSRYGVAQVDADGGMHKTIMFAESWPDDPAREVLPSPHDDIFDATIALPALRSGGLWMYAEGRAAKLMQSFGTAKERNDKIDQGAPLYAEDLVQGLRYDIWDAFDGRWRSLHARTETFKIGQLTYTAENQEGFAQAAIAAPAPEPNKPRSKDLYIHEAMARWTGWSLSAPTPDLPLTRDPDPDPDKVVPKPEGEPGHDPINPICTPFPMTTHFAPTAGSLPSLRFGRRYRMRARTVDICGNSLGVDDAFATIWSAALALPLDADGAPYLRFEPVPPPTLVLTDVRAVTDPGSEMTRLVIRTYNASAADDAAAADVTAAERVVVPPRISVEMAERLGMLDTAAGKLDASPAMYELIASRDEAELPVVQVAVSGETRDVPLVQRPFDAMPYIPDGLAAAVAFRDLPGAPGPTLGRVAPGAGPAADIVYDVLEDASPRPGSVTLVSFGAEADWREAKPFVIKLVDAAAAPRWDPVARELIIGLGKGETRTVAMSSAVTPEELARLGVYRWLAEGVSYVTSRTPEATFLKPGRSERIAQALQRTVEGGHWMLTPPQLISFVHAVQQPLGAPRFSALAVQHDPAASDLQSAPESAPTAEGELKPITAWRKIGETHAYLIGAMHVHGASTAQIDLQARWSEPVDDPMDDAGPSRTHHAATADAIPIQRLREGWLSVSEGTNRRPVAYYVPEADLLCFSRYGDRLGHQAPGRVMAFRYVARNNHDPAPRQDFGDTKRRIVRYTPRATSRYQEYFPQDQKLDFTRAGEEIEVDVPASARPVAPQVAYVVPMYQWQRKTETDVRRSVRFGGGLRIFLERPWYSSGEGELLGVCMLSPQTGFIREPNREKGLGQVVTQWGRDPIWLGGAIGNAPLRDAFPLRVADEAAVRTFELAGGAPPSPTAVRQPYTVAVAGHEVAYDHERKLWYCDVVINTDASAYAPFVRLALARYQPHALPDAKISPIVLADFAQLAPERSAALIRDRYHPTRLRLSVTGPAPRTLGRMGTAVEVTVQARDPTLQSDLAWNAATGVQILADAPAVSPLVRWSGEIRFAQPPPLGQYRVVIREYETYEPPTRQGRPVIGRPGKRAVYLEILEI